MVELVIEPSVKQRVWEHLIPRPHMVEEAAFLFASVEGSGNCIQLFVHEVLLLQKEDLSFQSSMHIELADEVRGRVIRRAHETKSVLIELHSHVGNWPVGFSVSDRTGFNEWVPHVRWRLKDRPYGAIVVGSQGMDGLYWDENGLARIDQVRFGSETLLANGLTELSWPFKEKWDE